MLENRTQMLHNIALRENEKCVGVDEYLQGENTAFVRRTQKAWGRKNGEVEETGSEGTPASSARGAAGGSRELHFPLVWVPIFSPDGYLFSESFLLVR